MSADRTTLYRHFDARGGLLYVGISRNESDRFRQHKRESRWAHEVARVSTEEFPTRKAALVAESFAIVRERPLYNKRRNCFWKEDEIVPSARSGERFIKLSQPREQNVEAEIREARALVVAIKQRLADALATIDDLRIRLDAEAAERRVANEIIDALLTDQRTRRPWWRWRRQRQ